MAVRITWKIQGFEGIRRAPGVKADVNRRASAIKGRCGPGYEWSPYDGATRHRASVITATPRAMVSNAKHNTLLGALDAGR